MTGETIDSIKIEIVGENTDAVSKLDEIIKKLGALKSSAGRQKGLENITTQLGEFSAAINRMSQSSLGRIDRIAEALGKMRGRFSIKEDVPVRITEIGDAVKTLADADFTKLEEMAKGLGALSAVGNVKVPKVAVEGAAKTKTPKSDMTTAESRTASSNVTVKAPQNPYAPGGKYYGQTKPDVKDLDNWGKLEAAGKNAFQSWATSGNQALMVLAKVHPALAATLGVSLKVVGVLAKIGRAVLNVSKAIISIPFKLVKSAIDGIVGKVQNLIRMFKKRMMYRLLNALLSQVSDAFSTGIKNLYEYSALLNGKFASSLDSISTSFLYLKNSIGAMVAPLINALAPAIDFVIDRVVELINLFNQLFALLTGASTWTKALKYPVQYGDESKKASKALKELKKSILGIDELNQLQDNSNRGGSGGGSSLDYSKMFTEMSDFNTPLKQFFDKLKQEAEQGNWTEIGKIIGGKINEGVQKIKDFISWDRAGEGIQQKLNAFFDIIDGIGDEIDWPNIGNALGEGFNTAMNIFQTVVKRFRPVEAATHITDMIRGLVDTGDFNTLAANIETAINNTLDFIITFLDTFPFDEIGKKFGEAFAQIDKKKIAQKIGEVLKKAVKGALDSLRSFIISSGLSTPIAKVWNAFVQVFTAIVFKRNPVMGQLVKNLLTVPVYEGKEAGEKTAKPYLDGIEEKLGETKGIGEKAGSNLIGAFGNKLRSDSGVGTKNAMSSWYEKAMPTSQAKDRGGLLSISAINEFGSSFTSGKTSTTTLGKVKIWLSNVFSTETAKGAGNKFGSNILIGVESGLNNPTGTKKMSFSEFIANIFNGNAKDAGDKTGKDFVDGLSNAIRKAHFPTIQYTIPDLQEQRNGRVAINPEIIDTGRGYAAGGFPTTGQMFLAREAGPELVGTIGNRTAVMNNEQIVDSVAQGVAEANEAQNALLREQNNLLRAILSNSGGGEPMTAQEILTTLGQWNRRVGAAVSPI